MVATFFLSTGRCGTQWFAKAFDESYSDTVYSVHEPVHGGYFPRNLFNGEDIEKSEYSDLRNNHIGRIEEIISTQYEEGYIHYIETGWPAYGAIPYLLKRFKGRIQIVHITRHPILTALSMTTHNYYGTGRETITETSLLTPFDKKSAFPELMDLWEDLSQFEKCLYFWTELNNYALEIEKETTVPWLRLKFEDLMGPDSSHLEGLLDFLDLPHRGAFLNYRNQKVDLYNYRTDQRWNLSSWSKIPGVADISQKLGYSVEDFDMKSAKSRYYSRDGEEVGKAVDR
ncbi:MAG: hypothetical protein HOL66_06140 [Rhodospirillaceae bacterium]|jgi:hypothetical protein|nr:hypothetical protein [Rhodospirillaceae bacterium]MBT5243803.1 hypothetical protein [Rhodospirillaceae bacterium]MBT5563747.1 hypothetical protein [Rhodospirillaceae bacterium]MBT6242803.1 hypothetical protein [Rhodospirillaceae bacterium]MBT7137477.1 hypothetical protein [Rhodospirillaceae bacterium]